MGFFTSRLKIFCQVEFIFEHKTAFKPSRNASDNKSVNKSAQNSSDSHTLENTKAEKGKRQNYSDNCAYAIVGHFHLVDIEGEFLV